MSSIQQQIEADNVQALKDGDKQMRGALSFLVSEIQAKAKDQRTNALTDAEAISLLQKQKKQRHETIAQSTGREDAITQANYEIALIDTYLPITPSEDEVKAVVAQIIAHIGATSLKEMGKVMTAARQRLVGVDSTQLSAIIKAALTSQI